MKIKLGNSFFALTTGLITVFSYFIILFLSGNSTLISEEFNPKFSFLLKIIYLLGFLLIGLVDFFQTNSSLKNLFTFRNLLILSLLSSMVSTVFKWNVSANFIGFFVFSALLYLLRYKEFFEIKKVFLFIFAFALLRFIGTIGTPKGFHFPDKIITFVVIPIAYSFFFLEKATMFRILKLFFRSLFLYICISLIFWFYNSLVHDISMVEWMTSKMLIKGLGAFEFVAGWSGYYIPTFISLVLLTGLVSGFYLHFQKNEQVRIGLLELLLYILFCLILEFALESRIGVVSFLFIILVNIVYFIKIKSFHFKKFLIATVVISIGASFYLKDLVDRVTEDEPRKIVYTLTLAYIQDHPWWGCGFGEQMEALLYQEEVMPDVNRLPGFSPYLHSHNQLLGEIMQFGVLGGVVFLVVLIALFLYSFRSKNYLLQMLLLIFLMAMLIDEPWYTQEGVISFNVFFAFFVALNQERKAVGKLKLTSKI